MPFSNSDAGTEGHGREVLQSSSLLYSISGWMGAENELKGRQMKAPLMKMIKIGACPGENQCSG